MLINNAVITGSFIVNGVDVTGITGSSNVSSSYLALSASFLVTSASYAVTSASYASASGSLSTRVTNLEATSSTVSSSFATTSGSLSTRVTNLESTSSIVSSSFATTSGSIAGRVTLIEGQYATTGSNNFTKPQQISDVSNAISFTSTASIYTDGGLRVKGSSFISGTAYFNDVVVYGTSSIEYITSSQLAIGTNIITLNTDTPSIRFGGISVFDSGSNNLSTGSLFWDSEKDKWIYSNPSASTYDGGMLISGPRNTSGLGNEVGTTSCALMMGQGGDHITSSAIFSYGNATCFYGQSYISSSGIAYFNGCVGIGSLTGSGYRLEVTNPSCDSGYANVFYGLHNANNTITIKQFGANHPTAARVNQIGVLNAEQHLYLVTDTQACIDAGTSTKGIFLKSGGNVGIGMQSPSEKLEICGALKINGVLCSTNISANSTYIDQTGGTARFLSYGPNSTTRGGLIFFQASSTNACQNTALCVDTSGMLYVSPSAVLSRITLGYNFCIENDQSPEITSFINSSGTSIFRWLQGSSPVEKMRLSANGSLGIGTNSPYGQLDSYTACSTSCNELLIRTEGGFAGGVYPALTFGTGGQGTNIRQAQIRAIGDNSYSAALTFWTQVPGTANPMCERIRISPSGNLGVGTTTPGYKLDVQNGWIYNYGAQNASGFQYQNAGAGHTLILNANDSYAQLYTSTNTSLYFGTSNDIRLKILSTGETCFKCNAYFCGSTYGIIGLGEKVFDKTCYVMTTTGTICLPLDGLTYGSGPTRAIYIYGTLLGNDSLQYAHMVYFYRNDYGGLQAATVAQASCAHPSTAGQIYTYTVNDPVGIGKSACTVLLRLTSSGAGVAPGSYCTQMRIVVYNIPG